MDKILLARNFSRFAHLYDKYADVQKKCGLELLAQIEKDSIVSILEIGCGTGNYTGLLRKKFKQAKIKAVDISQNMLQVAQEKLKGGKIEFVFADAEEANFNESFELITSNACLQWFEDLEAGLVRYKNLLTKGGVISFSIFGPDTFSELNSSLSGILQDASTAASSFIGQAQIKSILRRNFRDVRFKELSYTEKFLSLNELLNKIRYSGIRGDGISNGKVLTRRFLEKLNVAYLDKFSEIRATYQVFLCTVQG